MNTTSILKKKMHTISNWMNIDRVRNMPIMFRLQKLLMKKARSRMEPVLLRTSRYSFASVIRSRAVGPLNLRSPPTLKKTTPWLLGTLWIITFGFLTCIFFWYSAIVSQFWVNRLTYQPSWTYFKLLPIFQTWKIITLYFSFVRM